MSWVRLTTIATRRMPRLLLSGALVASLLTFVAVAVEPAPSSEAVVSCDTNIVYGIDQSTNQLYTFNSATGAAQSAGVIDTTTAGTVNAIAVPAGGGKYLYGFSRTAAAVVRYDTDNGDTRVTPAPAVTRPSAVIAGAFDPRSGMYFFAHADENDATTWTAYGYNPTTNAAPVRIGQVSGLTGGSGDFAFDSLGNLYLISGAGTSSGALYRVDTTRSNLPVTKLVDLPTPTAQYAAVAFDSVGRLVINSGSNANLYSPADGTLLGTSTISPSFGGQSDYASCLFPNTIVSQVDLPNGRSSSTDQFTVRIDNGGTAASTTGTTNGTDSGLQDEPSEIAGPTLGTDGATYQVVLGSSGSTNLNQYVTTWTCRDTRNGQTLGSGSGTSGSFTMPTSASYSDVVCTFTAVPKPTLQVVGAISGQRIDPADQFTVAMSGTGLSGTPQSATTSGAGSSAQTGTVLAQAGQAYTVTNQMSAGPSDAADYTQTISCVDTNNGNAAVATTADSTGRWTTSTLQPGQKVRCTITNTARPAGLDLVKTGGAVTGPTADGVYTVRHTITVKNTGPAATTYGALVDTPAFASNLVVTGQSWTTSGGAPAGSSATGTGPFTLAPAATSLAKDATHTYAVTTTFRFANRNAATACGGPGTGLYNSASLPAGQQTTTTSDDAACVAPPAPPAPSISLDKQAGSLVDAAAPTGPSAGDTIDYTFVVRNTGNLTLDPVSISDPKIGADTCPATRLTPGQSTTCTKTYTLTQDDVNAGGVNNVATASGRPSVGSDVTATDQTSTPVARVAAVSLDKTAGPITEAAAPAGASAGDTITYGFAVTNTGNVPVSGVTVSDPKVGAVSCGTATLQPGTTRTCAPVTYTLTQADVESGAVNNDASATATPPSGVDEPSPTNDSTSTPVPSAPAVTLDKSHQPIADGAQAGDVVEYRFVVTNSGNRPLSAVTVDDPRIGGTVSCPQTSLAPLAQTTCTSTYTLTQADVDAGVVDNTATVTATWPSGAAVSATDTDRLTIARTAGFTFDKVAAAPVSAGAAGPVGDTIEYRFVVTNTGTTTLTGLAVSDAKVGTVSCPATVAPGASATCTAAPYVVTQDDVDAGTVDNTATGTANPPAGVTDPGPRTDSTSTPISASSGLTLVKTADPATATAAGTPVTYTFVATNTGQVTLTDVRIADDIDGLSALDCSPEQGATLRPGDAITCTATRTTTQADADRGTVTNTATTTGLNPSGTQVQGTDSAVVTIPSAPAVELDKAAGPITEGAAPDGVSAGDSIEYTFTVRNAGNVTLTDVQVDDPMVGEVTCPTGPVAPGAVVTCSPVTYTLTQTDVDSGTVDNSATVTAGTPTGGTVSDDDSTSTPVESGPALSLVKNHEDVVDAAAPAGVSAGDTVHYTFDVTNTGNRTLDDVAVSDPQAGQVDCPVTTLAPGESTTCRTVEPYVLTQADVDAALLTNVAVATGTPTPTTRDADPTPVTSTDEDDLPIAAAPAVALDKIAGPVKEAAAPSGPSAGDTIEFRFVVTNTGNVTLDPITVADPKVGAVTCPTGPLAPGASVDCTPVVHAMTRADVDAGTVDNTASVTGTAPSGETVSDDDSTSTPVSRTATIDLVKSGQLVDQDDDGVADAGEVIAYAFEITNSGTVTISDATVNDPMLDAAHVAIACPATTLAPGETVTCTADYTVSASDVVAGEIVNTATASGDTPEGPVVSPPSIATVGSDVPVTPTIAKTPLLPNTGGASFLLLLAAATALVCGGLLIAGSRRRQQER